jgi:hypothetical protein
MLTAFTNFNLIGIPFAGQLHDQVTPLTAVQRKIFVRWDLSDTLT